LPSSTPIGVSGRRTRQQLELNCALAGKTGGDVMLHSYPDVCALGHKMVANVLDGRVLVQEKVDGSQLSFGIDEHGVLNMRSKNAEIRTAQPEGMFKPAVDWVIANQSRLHPGWIYRGEFLQKPKHNVLTYSRVPVNNVILFDICDGLESYLSYSDVRAEAERIGLEVVPLFAEGVFTYADILERKDEWLTRESVLGGTKVEGVVIKNYGVFTSEKKVAMAKIVRTDFQEQNAVNWKAINPSTADIIQTLTDAYRTEARWRKAVQHMRDSGELQGDMRDISALLKEVNNDVLKECKDEIAERLFAYAWPKISRGLTRGLPEWYRSQIEDGTL